MYMVTFLLKSVMNIATIKGLIHITFHNSTAAFTENCCKLKTNLTECLFAFLKSESSRSFSGFFVL